MSSTSVPLGDQGYSSSSSSDKTVINLETIRLQASAFVSKYSARVTLDTLRPLPVFLGMNEALCLSPGAFTAPARKLKSAPEKIQNRIQLNAAFFLTNYVLVASMTALIVALMHPGMILFVTGLYGLWTFHTYMIRNEVVVFGIALHSLLTISQRFYVLLALTTVVVLFKCLGPAIIFVSIASLLILTHAFLRDPHHVDTSSESFMGAVSDDDDEYDAEGGRLSPEEVLVEKPGE